ncbi:MAG: IclR family transcriptional regulator [Thermodesulfobacteriota bacterium]|nr:IclR family transcriptional regulator [Thermodesulfobacteriota bacterium]
MKVNQKKAPAVERALDVIELMAVSERDLTLSEIMGKVRIPRQSLVRILNTLCDRGILDRAEQRGHYRLGMKLLYLSNQMQDKINLRSVAWPFMEDLSQKTRKTIELSTLDRDQLILLERIEGSEGVNLYSRVGSVYPYFHAVGVGKVYLAHMDSVKRRNVLNKIGLPAVTEHTITNLSELEDNLPLVQKDGYAFENQELRMGVRRIAAPIFSFRGELVGCIGIAAPIFTFRSKDKAKFGKMAVKAAKRISDRLGFNKTTGTI